METAKLCRLCLTVKADMRPLDEAVLKQLNEFSGVYVEKMDGWPDKVCMDCVNNVSYCHAFKRRIEKSDKELRRFMDESKEPLSEEEVLIVDTESEEEETIILSDGSSNSQEDEANCSCDEAESEGDDTDEDDIEENETDGGNSIIFVDLTFDEVIEVEEHNKPDSTGEELEEIGQMFLESSTTGNEPKLHPNITLRRKRYTNRNTTVDTVPTTGFRFPLHIVLRSCPSFNPRYNPPILIPSVPITEPTKRKKNLPKFVVRESTHINGLIPMLPVPTPIEEFLESLDDKTVSIESCHPEALKFRTNFKENRDELVRILVTIYNEKVFNNSLEDVPFRWNNTLRRTGGRCWYRRRDDVRKVLIELSDKVCTSANRVRDVLIHELCHAAVWLFMKRRDIHGKHWQYWTNLANTNLPSLPKITRCHRYIIHYKYTYKCTVCNRRTMAHSKTKKIENTFCSRCHGPIEVFFNKRDINGNITLVKPKKPSMFAKYVKENYKLFKKPNVTHVEVMKTLSENYSKLTAEEKLKYRKSFGDM